MPEYRDLTDGSTVEAEQLERTMLLPLGDETQQGEPGDWFVHTPEGDRIVRGDRFEDRYLTPEAFDQLQQDEAAAAAEAESAGDESDGAPTGDGATGDGADAMGAGDAAGQVQQDDQPPPVVAPKSKSKPARKSPSKSK